MDSRKLRRQILDRAKTELRALCGHEQK